MTAVHLKYSLKYQFGRLICTGSSLISPSVNYFISSEDLKKVICLHRLHLLLDGMGRAIKNVDKSLKSADRLGNGAGAVLKRDWGNSSLKQM